MLPGWIDILFPCASRVDFPHPGKRDPVKPARQGCFQAYSANHISAMSTPPSCPLRRRSAQCDQLA